MEGKNDKILQPIQSLETNIEKNLSREEIESLLNKYALEGQFATLYHLITKIYDRKQIAKICGYDSPRYSDSLNNYFRCDALIWAIAFGHANVVTNYLDINSLEPYILELAFYLAVVKKQALIVELLLDDDRLDVSNKESFNDFFSIAIRLNDLATIRCLLQDDRLKLDTGKGFVLACGLGYVELVNLFNPSRCIQRKTIDDLETGWQIALKYKQMEVLKILLENDSLDPNKVLLEASKIGYSELVEYLLKNNRQINPGTQRSRSLHLAIEYGYLKVVQLLLDDGRAQPQALGNMAIRIATERGGIDIVRCLLADPRVRPEARKSEAMRNAVNNYHLEVIRLLMARSEVDLNVLVKCAANYKHPKNSIIPLFKIIIENNRVDFGTAITEVFQGGVYYEPDKQAVIKLLLAKLSLKQLATHLPNLLQSFSNERDFKNDSISRKLVQTVSIFNKHHSEHLKEDIPTEIDQMIGALMVRSCSMT